MKDRYLTHILFIIAFYTLLISNITADTKTKKSTYMQLSQEGIVHFSDLHSIDYEWKLLVTSEKGVNYLSVFDKETNTLLSTYSHSGLFNSFIRHQLIEVVHSPSPLLASVWQRGVHGEQFMLLDPIKDKVLYSVTSSWPLDFKVCGPSIVIMITGDNGKEGIPLKETHYWNSTEDIQIYHGTYEDCVSLISN